jgi:8-oxo-dGTP pyrophosphatase MutT (NUDIX family)
MPIWVRQAAAIPVQDDRICLVTSSSGRRWVVPKGQIDPGHTSGEAALVEAWEEAGLVGALDPEPLGTYVYEKFGRDHHVLVFKMTVTDVCEDWPERNLRTRTWVSVEEALNLIEEPGLRNLLRLVFLLRTPEHLALALGR